MNLINSIIKSVKELCNNDEICIMIVFILVGFMLCYLFKNQISGYINFGSPIEEVKNNENNLVGNKINQNNQQQIGIELKSKVTEKGSSNSVTFLMAAMGFPVAFFLFYCLLKQELFTKRKGIFMTIIIISIFSEPLLLRPFFLIFIVSGMISIFNKYTKQKI